MKSGVFGLVCPRTGKIVLVTSSPDIDMAVKKYRGDLKKMVGAPELYRWLCKIRENGYVVEYKVLEHCDESKFSEVKRKWIIALKHLGEAHFNINLAK